MEEDRKELNRIEENIELWKELLEQSKFDLWVAKTVHDRNKKLLKSGIKDKKDFMKKCRRKNND